MNRTIRSAALAMATVGLTLTLVAPAPAAAPTPRIDLKVLVVSDGGPATAAIAAELDSAGTPYTLVDLNQAGRPVISAGFLADTVSGRPRAKFQAVVLPNDNPFGEGSAEMAALATYEKTFAIPQVDAYTYARPEVGLNYPANGGYSGSLDGARAEVTAAGKAGPFGYLDGAVPFEDNSPTVGESYAFVAKPVAGADFTPYVEAPLPGGQERGAIVGEYRHDGRRELVVTFVYNQYQQQYRLLARGIVNWMTQGVHLGADRNYFAVHIDDVFAADDRWDSALNCTPGDVDCPPGTGQTDPIRMTAADAQYAAQWSQEKKFTLDMVYNGGGSEVFKQQNGGADPLAARLIADKARYRWVNHTYSHPYLGCVQDTSVVPWVCAKNADGSTKWVSRAEIGAQIRDNRAWGQRAGLPLDTAELVTGEHSGLKTLPQQPQDNPNLAGALTDNSIRSLASDNSREREQRQIGSALTVPRYPMNVFYNVGRAAEQVDEYNWIYTRKADGGSGICENSANTTCLDAPLDPATGYGEYIVPLETRIAMSHVVANDPRPHFIHQSNLAEDRIAYPVLDAVLKAYGDLHADNTPLVNLRQSAIGKELTERAAWQSAVRSGRVTAYRIGNSVTVQAPSGVRVTATMPPGTVQNQLLGSTPFGTPYAGSLSGWTAPALLQNQVSLTVPGPVLASATTKQADPVAEPADELPVPKGVRSRVPYDGTR
ncbi:hypothetical protein [Streptomyces indicus]|uniref:Uncharacterized protein n=1 Tax=Streptomyces indicus TaxID=417292 RepID=A0A1G8XBI7_9ACTN|nr:hypothetical protein [Streptomyces indicus]SDJ87265.1 hypothetical protein SAMN05421806_10384 [Streptomyces indicus]